MRQDVFAPQFDFPFLGEVAALLEGWAYDSSPAPAASSASSSSAVVARKKHEAHAKYELTYCYANTKNYHQCT